MTASDVTLALAFIVFVHALAGVVGHLVLSRAAFLGAARTEGGDVARSVAPWGPREASEAFEPVGWIVALATPFILALLVVPQWLRARAERDDGADARAFHDNRRRLYLFALCAIVTGGAVVELAPTLT